MSHGPTRIKSFGACIYCGSTGVRLTDEHIVPLSLGGAHILEGASCDNCSRITTRFEDDVARGLWGDARIAHNAPTRHRNRRPTVIVLEDGERPGRSIQIPYAEYPAPMVFYRMSRAGFLEGYPAVMDTSAFWTLEAVNDTERCNAFEAKYGQKLTAKFRHVPQSFGRLLAKIGFGQVLTHLAPSEFRPCCVPYILGQRSNLSFIVGCDPSKREPTPKFGYTLGTAAFGDFKRLILVAEVRLYSNNPVPSYHVVVGDVLGEANVASVLPKLGVAEVSPLVGHFDQGPVDHWKPSKWPLPPLH